MKMYISGYDMRPEYKAALNAGVPIPNSDTYDVAFNTTADLWTIPSEHAAIAELAILQRMNVRIGLHYCKLVAEDIGDGTFAIVCIDHPEPPKR